MLAFFVLALGLSGPATVIDGDTLVIGGSTVRLEAIDAPERAQMCEANGEAWPCGLQSAEALKRLIGRFHVTCEGGRRDRYGRILGQCFIDNQNLNQMMITTGWAMLYRDRDPLDWYWQQEAARRAKIGIWRGEVMKPWEWRDK